VLLAENWQENGLQQDCRHSPFGIPPSSHSSPASTIPFPHNGLLEAPGDAITVCEFDCVLAADD
jgi:hypothetical protein